MAETVLQEGVLEPAECHRLRAAITQDLQKQRIDFAMLAEYQILAFRQPSARAASSEQNHRTPLNQLILVA